MVTTAPSTRCKAGSLRIPHPSSWLPLLPWQLPQPSNFEQNKAGETAVNSFEKNINKLSKNKNLVKHYLGENVYYSTSNATQDTHQYRKVDNFAAQEQICFRDTTPSADTLDNHIFCQNKPAFKTTKSSKRSKHQKKSVKNRQKLLVKEERMMTPTIMETDEETDEDRNKELMLQQEIEKEQEYQNQMNLLYNSPEYFQQHYNQLQYQEEFHHLSQESLAVTNHRLCVPMYYIALPQVPQEQPHLDKEIFASTAPGKLFDTLSAAEETSSDYYSDSASCSDDCSDDETSQHRELSSFDYFTTPFSSSPFFNPPLFHASCQEYDGDVPLELDEELNNLVLSIISD